MTEQPGDEYESLPIKNDKVHVDFVGGDVVNYDSMSNYSGLAIGRGVQESIVQKSAAGWLESGTLHRLFRALQVEARQSAPPETEELLERIEHEVNKGEAANSGLTEKLLHALRQTSPDIARRLTDALSSAPVSAAIHRSLDLGGPETAELEQTGSPERDSSETATASQEAKALAALKAAIQHSQLAPAIQADMLRSIDDIRSQVKIEKASPNGAADLRKVQDALEKLQAQGQGEVDRLKPLLAAWLIEDPDTPASIRILVKMIL